MSQKPSRFILDVDGVMTDGGFYYTEEGKVMKRFGPHDSDGLKLLKGLLHIEFISADHRGFHITKKRIEEDMGYPLKLVSETERLNYVCSQEGTIFMGDGIFDAPALKQAFLGIAPANARREAKLQADYVTESPGGDGAVLDACNYIYAKYYA